MTGLRSLPIAATLIDDSLQVLDCSRRCLVLFDVTAGASDFEARLSQALSAATDLGDELALATDRLVETGDTDSFEWRRENHLIEVTATDDDDDGLTFLITFADVTDTRQMEQIQQQAWNYLEQILADITLGVAVLDAGLRITFVNDAGLRERFPLAEGDELALDVAAHPLHDRRGQSLGAILVIEDVTEKARLEDEVIRMERLATVGQMVITVNHEINNPLAIITTNAQAARLLNRDLNEKTVAKLLMIEAQVKRISEVTERLRTMEQVESDDYITDSPKMINIHNREDDHD